VIGPDRELNVDTPAKPTPPAAAIVPVPSIVIPDPAENRLRSNVAGIRLGRPALFTTTSSPGFNPAETGSWMWSVAVAATDPAAIVNPVPIATTSGAPAVPDTRPSRLLGVTEIAVCTDDSSEPTAKAFVVPP
jgi:hypothetical protein